MKPLYLTSTDEIAKAQKKAKKFRGYKYITPTHYDYGKGIGGRFCLNPEYVAKLLYKIDRRAVKANSKFFDLYPTLDEKIEAVISI